jgi:conjugative transfer region lipoprotein (TIGR03751 family)
VGLGLQGGDEAGMEGGMRWVEPDDAKPAEGRNARHGGGMSFPTSFGPGAEHASKPPRKPWRTPGARAAGVKTAKPVYTVPTNSTLMGSVAMTALIGRVPIDGTVNDPYPFKVLVGPDNLTANGIDIPDVAGAVFSGTASGDWTLSCVRGQVRSITFVFNDGTIRTIPEDREGNQQNNQQRDAGRPGLDQRPHGIPCVSGERRSNAQQYLGSQALITAAGAGVASLIKSDSGSMSVCRLGRLHRHRGHQRQGGGGPILAGGVRDMSAWVNKLYGQAFAAVYVQPGAKVAVHLEKPLAIDYDPKAARSITAQEKAMLSNLNSLARGLALVLAVAVLGGCATSKEKLLTHGDRTMMDIWQQEAGDGGGAAGRNAGGQLLDARQSLRRPLTDADVQAAPAEQMRYTRTARNEVHRQFQRLPNPDLVMYVYPHLAGTDPVPVPGYTTVFPLYQRVQYAMPGERVEDY